jgi:SAM-dependent methyltransferase
LKRSDYDDYATEYAASVAWRERGGVGSDDLGILPHLLDLLGNVSDQVVLDAGCGEGYLARILAARVTGVDLSPRLIAFHWHPVHSTYQMALTTARSDALGLPPFVLFVLFFGRHFLSFLHRGLGRRK